MAEPSSNFLPWRKAFLAAGVEEIPGNPRGYWGHASGHGGKVVCSVWDDKIKDGNAKAFVPKVNKGRYREAAENIEIGSSVVVILRSRKSGLGKVMPTFWAVKSKHLNEPEGESIGYLLLENTGDKH